MGFQVVYVPIGVGTFHLESAQIEFKKSIKMLSSITEEGVYPERIFLTTNDLSAFPDTVQPDLVVLQNIALANAAYTGEVLKRFSCPIALWTLREPVIDGGCLRLNSLTGAYSASNVIKAFRDGEFEYVFGSPEENEVITEIGAAVQVTKIKYQLNHLKMAAIDHTPQGFSFGRALDAEMMSTFDVALEAIEARELINKTKSYSNGEYTEYLDKVGCCMADLDKTPDKNVGDLAKLYKAYTGYVTEGGIGAVSSHYWPDFFTDLGTPVCSVLPLLNAAGVYASCETDVYGALSVYIGKKLTGNSISFGDPVPMNEKENTITFWHCGMAAYNLARKDTDVVVGVHPNRKIGPTMDFGCEACEEVTVFRIGRKPDGKFHFFVADGAVLDKPKQFIGTSIAVRTASDAKGVAHGSMKDGQEPHFVVIYGNMAAELEKLAHMLNVEVCRY